MSKDESPWVQGPKGIRWHQSGNTCSHGNGDVCRTCDFDRYYARTYGSCPWRNEERAGSSVPVPPPSGLSIVGAGGVVRGGDR